LVAELALQHRAAAAINHLVRHSTSQLAKMARLGAQMGIAEHELMTEQRSGLATQALSRQINIDRHRAEQRDLSELIAAEKVLKAELELTMERNKELPLEEAMRTHGYQELPHTFEEYVERTAAQRARREASRTVPGRVHISDVVGLRGEMQDLIATRQNRRDGRMPAPSAQARNHEHRLEQKAVEGVDLLLSIEREARTECEQ
jgi:hypothetical protein